MVVCHILLESKGLSHKQIADITGICQNTLRTYFREYLSGGIETLKEIRFYQPKSELEAHLEALEKYFRTHPVATIAEASEKIQELLLVPTLLRGNVYGVARAAQSW